MMSADSKSMAGAGPEEEAVTRLLRQMSLEQETTVPEHLEEKGLAAVQSAMRRGKGRRGRLIAWSSGVALAAGALLTLVVERGEEVHSVAELSASHGAVEIRSAGVPWKPLEWGRVLSAGSSVRTGAGSSAEFSMVSDVSVAMKQSSELSWLDEEARTVKLARGSASFVVEQLAQGEFFTVSAGQSTVTVHGTQFNVTLAEEAASPCVEVTHGLVEVRGPESRVWVSAGQSTGCTLAEEAVEIEEPRAEKVEEELQPEPAPQVVRKRPRNSSKPESSELAEQNRLFQKALVAEQAGDWNGARRHLDDFLAKYPESPLVTQVRAQRASLNGRK